MFNGALTEWFPTLGESWQVPQTPWITGWLSTPVLAVPIAVEVEYFRVKRCSRGILPEWIVDPDEELRQLF